MNTKKIIAICLVFLSIINLSACKKTTGVTSSETVINQENSNKKDYITLLYSAADTFNPYTAETEINRQLCKLLYEPLIKLSNEFEPINVIAESIELSGKDCTVKLRNLKFSDGTVITADDVVYSCNLALGSKGGYSAKLYMLDSVAASDSKTIVFKLKKADPYFINVLDFPILKAGSEKIINSDSVVQPPIGNGRYKVSDDRLSLVINGNNDATDTAIKIIKLINAPDSESVAHYIQIGASDIYYNDSSNGEIFRMSGQKQNINLNNLVYIGINQNYDALTQNALRQALSSGIDRKDICQNAFYTNALPATGFFNPVWEPVKAVQNIQIEAKKQITIENLEQIGYNSLDEKGNRKNSSGKYLKFTLLVNSENRLRVTAAQMISSKLLEYGIQITVIEKPYNSYKEALERGEFQLFLGEIKLTDNMDITCMVSENGSAAYGLKSQSATNPEGPTNATEENVLVANKSAEVVNGFYEGKNTITDVATVLQTEMPFIPICYRTGAIFYNDNIENVKNSSASDIYFSIESYIIK